MEAFLALIDATRQALMDRTKLNPADALYMTHATALVAINDLLGWLLSL